MSDSDPSRDLLNADQVLAESAALARHLQASGVEFLPAANMQTVGELAARFETSSAGESVGPESITPESITPESTTSESAKPESAAPQPVAAPAKAATKAKPVARQAPAVITEDVTQPYSGAAMSVADRMSRLQVLGEEVAACVRCEKLASCRTNTVFGEGNPSPRIVFFGEGPGADEDRSGRPFVGKAGQLLTKMIEACSFSREDVYILNTVKCRPPGNRNPDQTELDNCREYYEKQLQILRPEYIVCLGAVSSQALLKSKLSVGRLRGKFFRYFDSKVLVTYHPAYLLRTPAAKKAAWQDLQLMLRDAGIDPAARK